MIEKMYRKDEKDLEKKFLMEQLAITKEIIVKATPSIIVVNNAYTSRKIKQGIFHCEFDNEIGTYRLNEDGLNDIPIFFISMLTGQSALDKGSYERLIWHIKFVKEKLGINVNHQ